MASAFAPQTNEYSGIIPKRPKYGGRRRAMSARWHKWLLGRSAAI